MDRDYNKEAQTLPDGFYSSRFDAIMRRFIIREFAPYFKDGSALELGCHNGDFTELLAQKFGDLAVIEASQEMIEAARARVSKAIFVHAKIEEALPITPYRNVFLINVLEHVDFALEVLVKARDMLTEDGLLFVLVPNANAPSRQMAVKMGIVEHTQAVTEVEYAHGHRRTYNMETLCNDAKAAGLRIVKSGGIFFKGLSNAQFDHAIEAGVVTPEYMEAARRVGERYPDLCASIFVICERKP